jgi:hypothetical protein
MAAPIRLTLRDLHIAANAHGAAKSLCAGGGHAHLPAGELRLHGDVGERDLAELCVLGLGVDIERDCSGLDAGASLLPRIAAKRRTERRRVELLERETKRTTVSLTFRSAWCRYRSTIASRVVPAATTDTLPDTVPLAAAAALGCRASARSSMRVRRIDGERVDGGVDQRDLLSPCRCFTAEESQLRRAHLERPARARRLDPRAR